MAQSGNRRERIFFEESDYALGDLLEGEADAAAFVPLGRGELIGRPLRSAFVAEIRETPRTDARAGQAGPQATKPSRPEVMG